MKPLREFTIISSLPDSLKPLRELAGNLWSSWNREAINLFRHLDSDLWELTYHNPVALLRTIPQERFRSCL